MSELSGPHHRPSNGHDARSCSKENPEPAIVLRRRFFHVIAEILYPRKSAHGFHMLTGESERSCSYWLSGKRWPPVRAFLELLAALARRLG